MEAESSSERTNSVHTEPSFLETPQGRRLAYHRTQGELPGIVMVHGLNSTMDGEKCSAVDSYCRSRGRAFVRFELSGHGRSSGSIRESTVTSWLEDLSAVMESLTEGPQLASHMHTHTHTHTQHTQILVGSSLGGWLVFLYTLRNPEKVCGLVGIATGADLTQRIWKGLSKEKKVEVQRLGVYEMVSEYCPDPIPLSVDLFRDGDRYSILDMPGIEIIKVPTWLIHGDLDTVVPPDVSLQLLQKLECPVQLRSIEDGDHRLSRPQDIHILEQALTALLNPEAQVEEDDEDED